MTIFTKVADDGGKWVEIGANKNGSGGGGTWTPWTPTVSQGSVVTANNSGAYTQIGNLVIAYARVEFTSAGSSAVPISSTIPVTNGGPGPSYFAVGSFNFVDLGTAFYNGTVTMESGNMIRFMQDEKMDFLGKEKSFGIAAADILSFTITYQAADATG